VIVSASRGQYLKPGSIEPGFFLPRLFFATAFFRRAATPTEPLANRHDLVIMTVPPCDKRRTHNKKRADTARFFEHR
jgi:hypothetical protein